MTTPPLTPPESDLRDFGFMPLDVVRFAQSDLVAFAAPEAIVAAILLWGASWHQRPAASLTNDDRALANLAGFGRATSAWLAVKEEALRGFVLCSDGRLYHPVVAEKAREAWQGKLKRQHRTYLAAMRQHNGRHPDDQREAPSFEDWLEQGQPSTIRRDAKPMQQVELPLEPDQEASPVPVEEAVEPKREETATNRDDDNVTRDNAEESRATNGECHARVTHRDSSKGQGEGEGEGEGDSYSPIRTSDASASETGETELILSREALLTVTHQLARLGSVALRPERPGPFTREVDQVKAWLRDGIDVDRTIVPAIAKRLAGTAEDSIGSLKFYDRDIRKAHALALAASAKPAVSTGPRREPPPLTIHDANDDRVATLRARLASTAGDRLYSQWLGPDQLAFVPSDDTLVVTTRARFSAQWITSHYADPIRRLAQELFGLSHVTVRSQ